MANMPSPQADMAFEDAGGFADGGVVFNVLMGILDPSAGGGLAAPGCCIKDAHEGEEDLRRAQGASQAPPVPLHPSPINTQILQGEPVLVGCQHYAGGQGSFASILSSAFPPTAAAPTCSGVHALVPNLLQGFCESLSIGLPCVQDWYLACDAGVCCRPLPQNAQRTEEVNLSLCAH